MSDIITREYLEKFKINVAEWPESEVSALLNHLNETLDERVGTDIMSVVGPDNVDEALALSRDGDQAGLAKIVEESARDGGEQLTLQQIIDAEVDILLGEIAENADKLNEIARS